MEAAFLSFMDDSIHDMHVSWIVVLAGKVLSLLFEAVRGLLACGLVLFFSL